MTMKHRHSRPLALALACTALAGSLAGCSYIPTSGPTANEIKSGARRSKEPLRFQIVNLDAETVERLRHEDRALSAKVPTMSTLVDPAAGTRVDAIGPGDQLAISIFEVGVSLFAGGAGAGFAQSYDPSAHPQLFPDIVVDAAGTVTLPYLGRIKVAGLTADEVAAMIDRGLKTKSQYPQAVVTIKKNFNNTVFISGDVRKPGRFELSLNRERLLDAIAASGGSAFTAEDTLIRFSRGGRVVEERMGFIRSGSADDLLLLPGDRVELIKRPRSYTSFGAAGKAQLVAFETGDVSLAEAIARTGGPSDTQADASAIFLFRYDSVPDADEAGLPKLYRLNLLRPESYLIAQRLKIRDKDVLFFANAASNQPSKLVSILNQLFSPIVTARVLARQ